MEPFEPNIPEENTQKQFQPEPQPKKSQKWVIIGIVVSIVILILLGLGYWYSYIHAPNHPNLTSVSTANPSPTSTLDSHAGWKTYQSSIVSFSFQYPPEANYHESEPLLSSGKTHTGHEIYYQDANKIYPDFETFTDNFSYKNPYPQDDIIGSLKDKDSFKIGSSEEEYTIKTEVSPGMYQVVYYTNLECSPGVASRLIVQAPQGSNLKYISFFLGNGGEDIQFTKADFDPVDPYCAPLSSAILRNLQKLQASKDIQTKLNQATIIAKTFTVKGNTDIGKQKTTINNYRFNLDTASINEVQTPEVNCWISAFFGENAYRCADNAGIKDPCFIISNANKDTLVKCPTSIKDSDNKNIYKIAYPADQPKPSPSTRNNGPWVIVLENGASCRGTGGATFALGDKRANYSCDKDNIWLFGAPIENNIGLSTIGCSKDDINTKVLDTCRVKEVWY